jgi:uncharacterized membrane protein
MNNWPRLAGFLTRNKVTLLLILIFTASLSVRLYKLDSQTLECDELYTIPAATGHQYVYLSSEAKISPSTIPVTTSEYRKLLEPEPGLGLSAVRSVLKRNVHLPLYFYIIHYWVGWFGNSEWILRFPSALFGALTAMMIFLLGKELFNSFIGLASSVLLALSPEQIYFSQQARMYTLLAFLMVSATYAIILAARRTSNWPYVFFAVLSIAGLYTHYEYVFCLAAQTAYVWIGSRQGREDQKRWLITQLLIVAAFLPWILITVAQKKNSPEIIAWVNGSLTANLVLTEIVTKTARLISVPELPFGWLSVIITFVLVILGGISLAADRAKLFLVSAWIACPILGVLLMDNLLGTRAITITRYWLVIAPALYLLISLGLQRIKKRSVQIALIAGLSGFLFAAALLTAQGKLRGKPDRHQEMARFVDSQASQSGNQIVLTEGLNSLPLALGYYGQRDMNILRHKWLVDQLRQRSFSDITNRSSEILLMVSGQSRAVKLLEENGFRLEGQPVQYGHVVTARYVLNQEPRPLARPKRAVSAP